MKLTLIKPGWCVYCGCVGHWRVVGSGDRTEERRRRRGGERLGLKEIGVNSGFNVGNFRGPSVSPSCSFLRQIHISRQAEIYVKRFITGHPFPKLQVHTGRRGTTEERTILQYPPTVSDRRGKLVSIFERGEDENKFLTEMEGKDVEGIQQYRVEVFFFLSRLARFEKLAPTMLFSMLPTPPTPKPE